MQARTRTQRREERMLVGPAGEEAGMCGSERSLQLAAGALGDASVLSPSPHSLSQKEPPSRSARVASAPGAAASLRASGCLQGRQSGDLEALGCSRGYGSHELRVFKEEMAWNGPTTRESSAARPEDAKPSRPLAPTPGVLPFYLPLHSPPPSALSASLCTLHISLLSMTSTRGSLSLRHHKSPSPTHTQDSRPSFCPARSRAGAGWPTAPLSG